MRRPEGGGGGNGRGSRKHIPGRLAGAGTAKLCVPTRTAFPGLPRVRTGAQMRTAPRLPSDLGADAAAFLALTLAPQPTGRPTAHRLLSHPFLFQAVSSDPPYPESTTENTTRVASAEGTAQGGPALKGCFALLSWVRDAALRRWEKR